MKKKVLSRIDEAKLHDIVLDQAVKMLTQISKQAAFLVKDYVPNKLTRRVMSDYIGNDKKLKEIGAAFVKLERDFEKGIDNIKGKIVG